MTAGHLPAVQNDGDFAALRDIFRSRDNLNGLCSDICLTDNEFVCIGMRGDGGNLSDHNFFEIGVHAAISFDF